MAVDIPVGHVSLAMCAHNKAGLSKKQEQAPVTAKTIARNSQQQDVLAQSDLVRAKLALHPDTRTRLKMAQHRRAGLPG